jgi:hypothetical protein
MVPLGRPLSCGSGETKSTVDVVRDCVQKCKGLRLHCEVVPCDASRLVPADQDVGVADLVVLRAGTPLVPMVLERTAGTPNLPGVLVCPSVWSPPSRFLLVNDGQAAGAGFLRHALALCRQFRVIPLLLTWAASERAARRRQEKVRRLLDDGAVALFDTMVGGDVRAGVAGVARWRKCQAVICQRSPARRWFRWLGPSMPLQLLDLADSLAVLAIPAAETPQAFQPTEARPAAAPAFSMPSKDLDCARPVRW